MKCFLVTEVSQIQKEHKMSNPNFTGGFDLNKLCMIDLLSFWTPKFNCCLQAILLFSRNLSANNFDLSHFRLCSHNCIFAKSSNSF